MMYKNKFIKVIIWILGITVVFLFFALASCTEDRYINQKFIIVEKGPDLGNQYFLIRTIPFSQTMVQYDTINNIKHTVIITQNADTLYTVLDTQNFKYHKNKEWYQMSVSYNVGDTLTIETISKDKFWKKIK